MVYAILPAKVAEQFDVLAGGAATLEETAARAASTQNNALVFFTLTLPLMAPKPVFLIVQFVGCARANRLSDSPRAEHKLFRAPLQIRDNVAIPDGVIAALKSSFE